MRKMLLFPVLALALLMCMCAPEKGTVELSQDRVEVVSIELLHNPQEGGELLFVPFCKIEGEAQERFLDDLQEMEATWAFNDPDTELGELVICINYRNGDLDLIGYTNNICVVSGERDYDNWYFDAGEFKALIEKYAGASMPEGVFSWLEE